MIHVHVKCTLYTVHCTLYIVHCKLYIVHCTMYIVQCTLYNEHCTLEIKSDGKIQITTNTSCNLVGVHHCRNLIWFNCSDTSFDNQSTVICQFSEIQQQQKHLLIKMVSNFINFRGKLWRIRFESTRPFDFVTFILQSRIILSHNLHF